MQTIYKRFSVVLGFCLLLVVLIANALVTRSQLKVQISNEGWVAHTRRVLLELDQTESLIKDAETGQRGFLYTGKPAYLEPYNQALTELRGHLDRLSQLTADNQEQSTRVSSLRMLTNEKLGELAHTITLYRGGHPDEAKAYVLTDAGLVTMTKIRQVVDELQAEETSLEASRMTAYERSIRVTNICIYVATLIAALGLGLLAMYILREMGLREKHATQLRAREEWFRVTLTSVGEAVIATDQAGKVTFLNPLAERLTGITHVAAQGRPIEEVFPIFNEYTMKPVENPVKKVMELGKIVGLANHTVLQCSDGTMTPIEDSAAPIWDDRDQLIGVVLVFRDATEGRKSQEMLRRTEKLAAAARLSATMAHEINNPLEAVGNLIYIAKTAPDIPADAVRHLSLAEQELERVSHITRQSLGFYRESTVPEDIDMAAIVDSILTLYANKLQAKFITVHNDLGACPLLRGRSGEIKQAISNLIGNAADAVDHHGNIWVQLVCDEGSTGTQIRLTIEDDGPGIAEEHLGRIFEPFFTTKKDVGTGLGLWVTKEIVDRHGGTIDVSPRDEARSRGAAFHLVIPVSDESGLAQV
jgi:PAS domain S-box-containing protein